MDIMDENYPFVEIPSRCQILMINEQQEEIVIDNPAEQISPEQLLLMDELVNVVKRAIAKGTTVTGETQTVSGFGTASVQTPTGSSGASASAETPTGSSGASASAETPTGSSGASASAETPTGSSGATASANTPPTSEQMKELQEGVHRAIRMTIQDPSYRNLRQSFSVELEYYNIHLKVNIDPPRR